MDSSKDRVITKGEFEQLKRNSVPFEGYVSGLIPDSKAYCFVMSKPVMFAVSLNKSGTEFALSTTIEYVIIPLSNESKGAWIRRRGKKEYFYDRDVSSKREAVSKYGNDIDFVTEGSTLTTKDTKTDAMIERYRFFKGKDNKGVVLNHRGEYLVSDQIKTTESGAMIFGTSDNSLDAGTLHENLFTFHLFGRRFGLLESVYLGPSNPQTYGNNDQDTRIDNYDYIPRTPTDWVAYYHDKDYDALGIKGAKGAFLSTAALRADMKLTYRCLNIVNNPLMMADERLKAGAAATLFGGISIFKIFKRGMEENARQALRSPMNEIIIHK